MFSSCHFYFGVGLAIQVGGMVLMVQLVRALGDYPIVAYSLTCCDNTEPVWASRVKGISPETLHNNQPLPGYSHQKYLRSKRWNLSSCMRVRISAFECGSISDKLLEAIRSATHLAFFSFGRIGISCLHFRYVTRNVLLQSASKCHVAGVDEVINRGLFLGHQ